MRGLATFLVGTLIGAAAAVLTAPRSGRDAREDLRRRVSEGYDELMARTRLRATELMREGQEAVKTAQSRANQYADQASEQLDEMSSQQFPSR